MYQPGRISRPVRRDRFGRSRRPCQNRQHHRDQGVRELPLPPPLRYSAGVRPEAPPGEPGGPTRGGARRPGRGSGALLSCGSRPADVAPRRTDRRCRGHPHALDHALLQCVCKCPRFVCGKPHSNTMQGCRRRVDPVGTLKRPVHPKATGVPEGDRCTRKRPAYPKPTGAPEGDRRTRKRQKGPIFRARSSLSGPLVLPRSARRPRRRTPSSLRAGPSTPESDRCTRKRPVHPKATTGADIPGPPVVFGHARRLMVRRARAAPGPSGGITPL